MAADEIGDQLPAALVGDEIRVDAGLVPEHLSAHVRARAQRRRSEIELTGVGFGESDQARHVLGLHRWMHEQHKRQLSDQPDCGEVLARIEAGVDVERRIDADAAGVAEHQRVAVRRRLDHGSRADDAGTCAAVLDNDGPAEAGVSRSAMMRAMASLPPPGGNGTTSVMVFDG